MCNITMKSSLWDDKIDVRRIIYPWCFELFGYDISVDSDLKPWLLEGNDTPLPPSSLDWLADCRETKLDVKSESRTPSMIADIIRLLDPAQCDAACLGQRAEKKEVRFE